MQVILVTVPPKHVRKILVQLFIHVHGILGVINARTLSISLFRIYVCVCVCVCVCV